MWRFYSMAVFCLFLLSSGRCTENVFIESFLNYRYNLLLRLLKKFLGDYFISKYLENGGL